MRGALPALLLAAASAVAAQDYSVDDLAAAFGRDIVVIDTAARRCLALEVFVAATPQQRQRGLMFVRHLPADTGMLFVYGEPAVHSMWMKNTYIPLDMLFIRADGSIAAIVANTEPLSLESISAGDGVQYVLELNGGAAARLRIDAESRLLTGGEGP